MEAGKKRWSISYFFFIFYSIPLSIHLVSYCQDRMTRIVSRGRLGRDFVINWVYLSFLPLPADCAHSGFNVECCYKVR